jgi:DNA-binding HxlR family transcriptional regulator
MSHLRREGSIDGPCDGFDRHSLIGFGLIRRRDFGTVPANVQYRLTPTGKSSVPVIAAIRESGERHLATA